MKKYALCIVLLVAGYGMASAQIAIQPQVGLTMQATNKLPAESSYKAKAGYLFGLDARLGKQLYL